MTFADLDWQPLVATAAVRSYCYDARSQGFPRRVEWASDGPWDVSVEESAIAGGTLYCHALNLETDEDDALYVSNVAHAIEFVRRYLK